MNEQVSERRPVYTVDEALNSVGFGKYQGLVLCYAGLGWVAEAMEIMILSFIGPALKDEWNLSPGKESLITTVVFAGMLLGAYTWGFVSDNYGRRMGLLSVAAVTTGAGFLSTFSPNYASLVFLRFLTGFGLGGGPVYLSWFLEFVPAQKRGAWMVVFSTFWTFGTILEASLAWIIMPRLNWRWLLAVSSVPSFMALFLYVFAPESPRYLLTKGRVADAQKILEKIARHNRKSLPSGMPVADQNSQQEKEISQLEEAHVPSSEKTKATSIKTKLALVLKLFSPRLLRTTLSLWMLFFGNAFSYYGIILLTSKLSNGPTKCGSGSAPSEKSKNGIYLDVFITSFAELPGLLLSAVLVDWIGRKLTMEVMFLLGCGFLLPLVTHQNQVVTTIMLFGTRMCMMGSITVANIYAPELYPTWLRSTGYGVASSVGRIGGMICPLVAVGLVANCHQTAAVLLFVAVIVVSAISVIVLPLETTGKELTDTEAPSN